MIAKALIQVLNDENMPKRKFEMLPYTHRCIIEKNDETSVPLWNNLIGKKLLKRSSSLI